MSRISIAAICAAGLAVFTGALAAQGSKSASAEPPELRQLLWRLDSANRFKDSVEVVTRARMAAAAATGGAGSFMPFGLMKGMTEKALREVVTLGVVRGESGVFSTVRVPVSHPEFDSYRLMIGPKAGLCKIVAAGRNIETSVFGAEARSVYENIEAMVSEKYGSPTTLDFLRAGSVWDEPQDWMMGLLRKDRIRRSLWEIRSGTILLELGALSSAEAFVRLSYEFPNFTACAAELGSNPF